MLNGADMSISRKVLIRLCVYLFIQIPLVVIGTSRRLRSKEPEEADLDIKQGEYRLYNHVDGQEVGCITISKVSESYHISLEGNPYEYVNKYSGEHISYDSVRINDAVLSVEEIKDRKALIGEAGG